MFTIITSRVAAHGGEKGKLTCMTCALKKCVGRCHFERVESPRPKRVA
jgi:hypothetical protein